MIMSANYNGAMMDFIFKNMFVNSSIDILARMISPRMTVWMLSIRLAISLTGNFCAANNGHIMPGTFLRPSASIVVCKLVSELVVSNKSAKSNISAMLIFGQALYVFIWRNLLTEMLFNGPMYFRLIWLQTNNIFFDVIIASAKEMIGCFASITRHNDIFIFGALIIGEIFG